MLRELHHFNLHSCAFSVFTKIASPALTASALLTPLCAMMLLMVKSFANYATAKTLDPKDMDMAEVACLPCWQVNQVNLPKIEFKWISCPLLKTGACPKTHGVAWDVATRFTKLRNWLLLAGYTKIFCCIFLSFCHIPLVFTVCLKKPNSLLKIIIIRMDLEWNDFRIGTRDASLAQPAIVIWTRLRWMMDPTGIFTAAPIMHQSLAWRDTDLAKVQELWCR